MPHPGPLSLHHLFDGPWGEGRGGVRVPSLQPLSDERRMNWRLSRPGQIDAGVMSTRPNRQRQSGGDAIRRTQVEQWLYEYQCATRKRERGGGIPNGRGELEDREHTGIQCTHAPRESLLDQPHPATVRTSRRRDWTGQGARPASAGRPWWIVDMTSIAKSNQTGRSVPRLPTELDSPKAQPTTISGRPGHENQMGFSHLCASIRTRPIRPCQAVPKAKLDMAAGPWAHFRAGPHYILWSVGH